MSTKIWLSPPHLGGNEMKYVKEAFDQNWIAPLGPNVDNFEIELANYLGIKSVAALSSGTAAIHLALLILGVKPGDDVLCSTFTFCASANPIVYVGANPVFIDSDMESWNMSPDLLEKSILDGIAKGNKPTAIILVHLYGMPSKLDEIVAISDNYNIPIIEDAAEALGSEYKGRKLGTFGDIGVFSFNGNKIITTSGGGALVSNNENHIKKAKFLATQSLDPEIHYEHSQIGYNYRMSNILAGIGRGQLEILDLRVKQKRVIQSFYSEQMNDIEYIQIFDEWSEDCFSNFWLTTILFDNRNRMTSALERYIGNGIGCRPLWKPMHLQPVFNKCKSFTSGVSEDLFNRGLCLPSGTTLSESELNEIVGLLL